MNNKKVLSAICCVVFLISVVFPAFSFALAEDPEAEITLSDTSKWKILTDADKNTFTTDDNGRYYFETTAPDTDASSFKVISQKSYPLSSGYLMRCYEGSGAENYFGLSTEYSLGLNDSNSIRFCRVNGYNGEENTVALKILCNGKYEVVISKAGYTRNRFSKIGVVKQNGSYYLSWNGIVLNGNGCSKEVEDACKLENHFATKLLDNGAFMHFYCGCSKMHLSDGFCLQIEKSFDNGFLKSSIDNYGADPNNPALMSKANEISGSADKDNKVYSVSIKNSGSSTIAPMVPVTAIDEEGNSPTFRIECYNRDFDVAGQQWFGITFSDDPTFSNGKEKTIYYVQIANKGGVHCGYFDGDIWKTYFGANNNLFNNNDPDDNARYYYFGKSDGKVYLYVYGSAFIDKSAAYKIEDFSQFTGKNIYVRFNNRSVTTGATTTAVVTPSDSENISAEIEKINKIIDSKPESLDDITEVIEKYDSNPYRYAVSTEKILVIEELRLTELEKKEEKLKNDVAALRKKIDELPAAKDITSSDKDKIKSAFLDYIDLGENKNALGEAYIEKLNDSINALSLVDEEFAGMKKTAEEFYDSVKAVGKADDITVANFYDKNEAVVKLRNTYSSMEKFQYYLVDDAAVGLLSELEERIEQIKPAYQVVEGIKQLPSVDAITYKDEMNVCACRDSYNNLTDKSLVEVEYTNKLTECEKAVKASKLKDLDWYSPHKEVSYTGDLENAYKFARSVDLISGDVIATTTKTFDAKSDCLYWVDMGCGSGQFAIMGLCTTSENASLSPSKTDCISFILRPSGTALSVVFFDKNGETERVATISGFNLAGLHKFEFVKESNHWYLVVDGNVCSNNTYDRFDTFMETYGDTAHFFIGGRNGFSASNVTILNKNISTVKNGWDFSVPYGCNASGDSANPNLTMPNGTQAVYQTKLDSIENWSININANIARTNKVTYVGFLKDKKPNGNTLCNASENGIVLMLYNRPAQGDNRTHILLNIDGKIITYSAYEPAIMDADYFTLSVSKASDMHYYLKISWQSGSVAVKFDRSNEHYKDLLADYFVENGAYFTITTNYQSDVDLEFKYEEKEDVYEDTAAASEFIVELEKNLPALKKLDKNAYQKMYEKWQKLDFSSQNSVAGDFFDDELAFNILSVIKNFEDQEFDEYVIKKEERIVSKSSINSIIEECKSELAAQFRILLNTGKVLFSNFK